MAWRIFKEGNVTRGVGEMGYAEDEVAMALALPFEWQLYQWRWFLVKSRIPLPE